MHSSLIAHLLLTLSSPFDRQDDDVRKYVNTYRRTFEKNGKKHSKAPKIQRYANMVNRMTW